MSLDNWPGAAAAGGAHATPDPQPGSQPDTSFSQQPLQQKEEQQEHGSGEGGAAGSAAAPVSGGGSGNGPMGLPGPVLEPGSAAAGEGSTGAALGDSICPLGYAAVLDTCLDVARAMLHMHSESIVHGDLKARNILLKSGTAGDGRNYVAKVGQWNKGCRVLGLGRMGWGVGRCSCRRELTAGADTAVIVDRRYRYVVLWIRMAVGALAGLFPGSWGAALGRCRTARQGAPR